MNIKQHPEAVEIAMPKKPCVYFLTNENGVILYVGKSKNKTIGRIASHQYAKEFSRAFFITCSGYNEMDALESKLILKHRPKYNYMISDKKSVGMLGISDIKKQMKVDLRIIRRAASEYNVGRVMIGSIDYYDNGILEAIKKSVRALKSQPLSMDSDLWISLRSE